jgi:hypothetical protein
MFCPDTDDMVDFWIPPIVQVMYVRGLVCDIEVLFAIRDWRRISLERLLQETLVPSTVIDSLFWHMNI